MENIVDSLKLPSSPLLSDFFSRAESKNVQVTVMLSLKLLRAKRGGV